MFILVCRVENDRPTSRPAPAIVVYAALFALPLIAGRGSGGRGRRPAARVLHLTGLGLLIHIALDWTDCMM